MPTGPIPPIMTTRGLKLIEIGEDGRGSYLKFAANKQRVREVTIYMQSDSKIKWRYVYAIYDSSTRTVVGYEGTHGDPDLDERVDVRGV